MEPEDEGEVLNEYFSSVFTEDIVITDFWVEHTDIPEHI